jgi:hypothetical protein
MGQTWSWKVVRISGIVVSGHATCLLLVVWFAGAYWFETKDVARVASRIQAALARAAA